MDSYDFSWYFPSVLGMNDPAASSVFPFRYQPSGQGLMTGLPSAPTTDWVPISASDAGVAQSLAAYRPPAEARPAGPVVTNPGAKALTRPPAAPVSPDQQRFDALMANNQQNRNLAYANLGLQGLGLLGQLGLAGYGLYQAHDALNFQKKAVERNFENQIRAYNNAMEDRIRGRSAPQTAARYQDSINADIEKRKLS